MVTDNAIQNSKWCELPRIGFSQFPQRIKPKCPNEKWLFYFLNDGTFM